MIGTLFTMLLMLQMAISPARGSGAISTPPSGAGITFVASAIGSGTGGTGTTSTSLNVTAGDKLIVFCQTNGSNNTISMSDTVGNTFSKGTHQNDGSIGNTDMFWVYSSGSNAADFFTCTNNNAASPNIVAMQYRGGASSGSVDVHLNGSSAGSGSWITSSFTTATANEVVVQCLTPGSVAAATVGTIGAFTANVRAAGSTYHPFCQDYSFTTIQTGITAKINLPGTNSFNGQLVALP